MKITKLNNIQGVCSKCGKQIDTGYLYQANNGEAFKVLCEDCFLSEQQEENKTVQHLTVKEQPRGLLAFIFNLFGVETRIFKVMNCEDVLLPKYITASELLTLQEQGAKIKIYK